MENSLVVFEHIDLVDALERLDSIFFNYRFQFFIICYSGLVDYLLLSSLASFPTCAGVSKSFR